MKKCHSHELFTFKREKNPGGKNEKSHLVLKKLLRILNIKSHRNYSKFVFVLLIRKKKGKHILI